MIDGWYWKYLGAALILYSILAGMLVPLQPGIQGVSPASAKTGERVRLEVHGYNTNFDRQSVPRAWLKDSQGNSISSKGIGYLNASKIYVIFSIPNYLPTTDQIVPLTLIVDNPEDGAMVSPDALFVSLDTTKTGNNEQWKKDIIKDLNLNSAFTFPNRNILRESIRNTFFHVPLWFAMVIIFGIAVYWSIKYLNNPQNSFLDNRANAYTDVGILLGILGTITGALWAKFSWGSYWSWDIKQIVTAVALLIYLAYFVLRSAIEDDDRKGRIAAVYNIFAFVALIPLIFVVPRMMDSLHPGNGGNPGMGANDLDNTMRMVFYPAIIGWILLGIWLANVRYRTLDINYQILNK